jgi:uncharacterized protein (DUF362 family)
MGKVMIRRDFIKTAVTLGTASLVMGTPLKLFSSPDQTPEVIWVTGGEPPDLLEKALKGFSGLNKFVSKGDVVVIKPNMGWDRAPQFAANTNPDLIAALIKSCFNAGAAKVKIFDRTCNNPQRCYRNSEIEKTARDLGAEVDQIRSQKFKEISLPEGEILKEWPIYQDYLEADKVINVPIAKHHSMARMTAGLKNLMGVMGGNRGEIHNNFSVKINDINAHILPTLTIIDGYQILLRNGPSGGNINDVKLAKALIMSPCIVTADLQALQLFNLKPNDVPYLQEAVRRGLNKYDPANPKVLKIKV